MEKVDDFSGNTLLAAKTLSVPVYYSTGLYGNAGNVIYNATTKKIMYWDDFTKVWVPLSTVSTNYQLTNSIDPGFNLVPNAIQPGPDFTIRKLYSGAGVDMVEDDDTVTIDTQTTVFTLDNVGGGFEFVRNAPQSGTSFTTRNVEQGPGMTVSATAGQVILSLTTMSDAATGVGCAVDSDTPITGEVWNVVNILAPTFSSASFTTSPDSIAPAVAGKFIATAWVSISDDAISINKRIISIRIVKRKIATPSIREVISSESRIYAPGLVPLDLTNGVSVSGVLDTVDNTEELILEFTSNVEALIPSAENIALTGGFFSVVKM